MKRSRIKLLFIDDELHNLDSLRASYRREWEIYTASNAFDADKVLAENDISVILCDHMMPIKTGVELLEEYAAKYPHIARILITAHGSTSLITKAINRGKINYFLEKPWSNETLRQAVTSCHNIAVMSREIQEKNELLTKAYDDLSRFIYSASHEMRSPLMSILGLIELAREEELSPVLSEYLGLMQTSVNNIDGFIHGIIEYYKNSQIKTTPIVINFEELISEVKKELVNKDECELKISIEQEEESVFRCDPFRLKIVLTTLLSSVLEACRKKGERKAIDVHIKANPFETTIEIGEEDSSILYTFVENVFRFFFSSAKTESSTISPDSNVMDLFLFKDSLLMLGGSISLCKKENVTTYLIKIPGKNG